MKKNKDLKIDSESLDNWLKGVVLDSDSGDAAHGLGHVERVWRFAKEIAQEYENSVDLLVIKIACYFHDLVNPPKDHPDRSKASLLSAQKAVLLCRENLNLSEQQLTNLHHTICAHSFSANIPTKTIEAQIVQDADRLESLGALGIARTFYTSGKLSSDLFHPTDPLAKTRNLDDLNYALDHFENKLYKVAHSMKTQRGQLLAQKRVQFMRRFVEQLQHEIQ